MIIFGKLIRTIFESEDKTFAVYDLRIHGGQYANAVFKAGASSTAPPSRKTVELKLSGSWQAHPKFGKQFVFGEFERAESCQKPREKDVGVLLSAKGHAKMRNEFV